MGVFGPFICAYCGREHKVLTWTIKGGKNVCGKCCDMLTKEMNGSKWQHMTIAQIREYMADKDSSVAEGSCALCGRPYIQGGPYTFRLGDKSRICGRCAGSVRIVSPVFVTMKTGSSYELEEAAVDPLAELGLDDVRELQKKAEEEREKRREKYGDHKGVFIVDDVTRYFKEEDAHQIWGQTVLGRIDKDDTVTVMRREGPYSRTVTWVDPLSFNSKSKAIDEGQCGALMVLGDVSFIYPGDVLVTDGPGR